MGNTYFFDIGFSGTVDSANGIIRGVSVCTAGVKARGHDMETDQKTLLQMKAAAVAQGGKVPVKWNHQTGADAVNGYVTNFHIDGDKLKADWHLLKSHDKYAQAVELAERMPANIGLSAAFKGEPEKKGGKKFARCKEILAVDLVAHPAANPDGLFEERIDSARGGMSDEANNNAGGGQAAEPSLSDVMEAIADIKAGQEDINARLEEQEAWQEQVQAELEGEGDDDGELDDEGEEGEDGEEEGEGGEAGAELSIGKLRSAQDVVRYFEARENRKAAAQEQQAIEFAFQTVTRKGRAVVAAYQELAAEHEEALIQLQAANEQIELLSAGGGRTTAGVSRDRGIGGTRRGKITEFESRVAELKEEGMTRMAAVAAIKRDEPHLFAAHYAGKGIISLD